MHCRTYSVGAVVEQKTVFIIKHFALKFINMYSHIIYSSLFGLGAPKAQLNAAEMLHRSLCLSDVLLLLVYVPLDVWRQIDSR